MNNTRQDITAVGDGRRSFYNLGTQYTGLVYFDAVLIAPLLSLLPHAIVHHHYPVVTKPADHRFGYARARADLCQSRFLAERVDDIVGSRVQQLASFYERYRNRCMP